MLLRTHTQEYKQPKAYTVRMSNAAAATMPVSLPACLSLYLPVDCRCRRIDYVVNINLFAQFD